MDTRRVFIVPGAVISAVLLATACENAPPPRRAATVETAAGPDCTTLSGRFSALDVTSSEGHAISSRLGAASLPTLSHAALACKDPGQGLEVLTSRHGAVLRQVRYGWRVDHLWRSSPSSEHLRFTAVALAEAAPPGWQTLDLGHVELEALLREHIVAHDDLHGVKLTEPDELDRFIEGPFTAPGRNEAVVTVWGGLSHHDGWQLWLLERSDTGQWHARHQLLVSCSGSVDALDLDHDGRLELVVDESCMHHGRNDGSLHVLSLGDRPGGGVHVETLLELPHGDEVNRVLDVLPLEPGAPRPLELAVRTTPCHEADDGAAPTFERYRLRGGRLERVP